MAPRGQRPRGGGSPPRRGRGQAPRRARGARTRRARSGRGAASARKTTAVAEDERKRRAEDEAKRRLGGEGPAPSRRRAAEPRGSERPPAGRSSGRRLPAAARAARPPAPTVVPPRAGREPEDEGDAKRASAARHADQDHRAAQGAQGRHGRGQAPRQADPDHALTEDDERAPLASPPPPPRAAPQAAMPVRAAGEDRARSGPARDHHHPGTRQPHVGARGRRHQVPDEAGRRCMKPGDVIDADTAELIADEFGHTSRRVAESDIEEGLFDAPDDRRGPRVAAAGRHHHGPRRPRQDVAARRHPQGQCRRPARPAASPSISAPIRSRRRTARRSPSSTRPATPPSRRCAPAAPR